MDDRSLAGWYYAAVFALMLFGQHALLSGMHQAQMAKLKKQYDEAAADAVQQMVDAAPAATTSATLLAGHPSASPATAPSSATTPAPKGTITEAAKFEATPAKHDAQPTAAQTVAAAAPALLPTADEMPATRKSAATASPGAGSVEGARPALPVAVAFRREPFAKGKVVVLTNTGAQKLDCKLKVSRPGSGAARTLTVALTPGSEKRVTRADGWTFATGDRLQIADASHATKEVAVP